MRFSVEIADEPTPQRRYRFRMTHGESWACFCRRRRTALGLRVSEKRILTEAVKAVDAAFNGLNMMS